LQTLDTQNGHDIRPNDLLDISVLIPVMNEEESLDELYTRLSAALAPITERFEILFVDDGSTDHTFEAIRALRERDERVKVIRFRRNYGKTAALVAGFERCRGEVIITMDGDLQDEPTEIPKLLDKLREYDLVSGWKKERHDPRNKTLPSRIFNTVVSRTTGLPLHDFNCGFKAYRREVTQELTLYSEFHRFIPVLADWRGFRVTEVAVQHNPRKYGYSKFGAMRFLRGLLDFLKVLFIMKYLQRPLHFFGPIAAVMFILGVILGIYLTGVKFIAHQSIGTRPALTLTVLLIVTAVQLFSLGLLGEMLRNFAYRSTAEFSIRQTLE
jgi:glycosyltransferase involved in cell wall biosynthesis